MNYYIGIDLGGTNVRVAKVDEEGRILKDVIAPSHGKEGPERSKPISLNCLKVLTFQMSNRSAWLFLVR